MAKRNYLVFLLLLVLLITSCTSNDAINKEVTNEKLEEKNTSKENSSNEEKKEEKEIKKEDEDKLVIYTTIFPVYDLTKRIVRDKAEIKLLVSGTEQPHGFEPTASQLSDMSNSDIVVYNGAGMEEFIDDFMAVISNSDNPPLIINLSESLKLLTNDASITKEEALINANPHTWLSIKNALIQLDTIYNEVSYIDPHNASFYKANYEKEVEKFSALDKKFEDSIAKIKGEKYFVVSHAAFNYLANDYGLKQVAVTGISPDEEPSAKKLRTIADFVRDKNINTIFFEGKATPKVAETLARETGTKTSMIYTMEALTEEETKMGYLKLMEMNLENLLESFKEE